MKSFWELILQPKIQSKMRHGKHNSSICQTTTLLSMSNVSADSEEPSLSLSHHQQLLEKMQELAIIMHTTLAEKSLLAHKHTQLQTQLAARKATLQAMLDRVQLQSEESSEEELGETCRMGGWRQQNCGRTVKNHQKFYSAIQSPSLKRSPERKCDQLTLLSYHRPRHTPQPSNFSAKTGLIRKQSESRLQNTARPPSYASPRQRDYESIEEIWNQSKPPSHRGIKSFL